MIGANFGCQLTQFRSYIVSVECLHIWVVGCLLEHDRIWNIFLFFSKPAEKKLPVSQYNNRSSPNFISKSRRCKRAIAVVTIATGKEPCSTGWISSFLSLKFAKKIWYSGRNNSPVRVFVLSCQSTSTSSVVRHTTVFEPSFLWPNLPLNFSLFGHQSTSKYYHKLLSISLAIYRRPGRGASSIDRSRSTPYSAWNSSTYRFFASSTDSPFWGCKTSLGQPLASVFVFRKFLKYLDSHIH